MTQKENSPYRKHPKWHDYTDRGIYMITLVVSGRDHIFGELNMDAKNPGVILSETGKMVQNNWYKVPEYQAKHGLNISIINCVVMPDHFHGIIFVKGKMPVKLGTIIQGFKSGCTRDWRKINGLDKSIEDETASHLSVNKRIDFYQTQPRLNRPLFDPDYDDSILYKHGQLQNMIDYVKDNPRRAILRKLFPDLFRRVQKITIEGRNYSAFGNIFLLRMPHKEQVFFHRFEQSPENLKLPFSQRKKYEDTELFQKERADLLEHAKDGTVLVNPAISKGEQILKNDCFEQKLKMIQLQKTPVNNLWKPEKQRFEACVSGNLLILAPLDMSDMDGFNNVDKTSKYSEFHNINLLAEKITGFYGKMSLGKVV